MDMSVCNKELKRSRFSRRGFLKVCFGSLVLLPASGFFPDPAGAKPLSKDPEIVFVSSLGFIKLHSEPVEIPEQALNYLLYGNTVSRRMLADRTVRPDGDLLKACVRDWPAFKERVREDAVKSFYPGVKPGGTGDPLERLTPYAAIGMAVKLAAERIRYDFGVAALAGNDDVDGDGRGDGLNREMLKKVPDADARRLATHSPESLRRRYAERARRIDSMSIDELYEAGVGVCRHQTLVAMAVFRALKEDVAGLENLYLTGLASIIDRHQWLMAAAIEPDKITIAFYDPTASSGDRARAVRAFTDVRGKRRYMGIPDEGDIREEMGLGR